MGRISTRSNPTNLRDIEKQRVGITLMEENGKRSFSINKLDFVDLKLDGQLQLICVARAGSTSQRFHLGTINNWRKEAFALEDVDPAAPLQFRVLVHGDNPQLVASAERVRLRDQGQAESLLPMEPADLGEEVWRLIITENDGPILQFNAAVFPSAAGVENYFPFGALVLPEALRRVMEHIAKDPARLEDENDPISAWGPWLDALGVDRPEEDEAWPDHVVRAFCERHRFASRFAQQLQEAHE